MILRQIIREIINEMVKDIIITTKSNIKKYKLKDNLEFLFKMIYSCQICNYQTPVKCNYMKHMNTKKHLKNTKQIQLQTQF